MTPAKLISLAWNHPERRAQGDAKIRSRAAEGAAQAPGADDRPDPRGGRLRYAPAMQRYAPGTALIVVDVQNDFADPAGSLSVANGTALIPRINREIETARNNGAIVVATQDWHPPSTPHFAKDGGIWPVHCVADTWGAELHPDLVIPDDALRVRKGTKGEDGYSAFTMRDPVDGETTPTELEGLLRAKGVERVVLMGLATDYCIKATALDARRLGFDTHVLTDACAPVNLKPGDGARAIDELEAAGVGMWQTVMR